MKPTSFEKTFQRAMEPLEDFLHRESSSGLLLMACVAAAIIIANSSLFSSYDDLLHTEITIGSAGFSITHSLHHWINDGLMALFFFVIGLEVKREILIGELSDFRQALLPIAAALGGMVVPAACYFFLNRSGDAVNGWGIPMATDIAFAVGVITLLGPRVPKPLVAILLALAIVDDIGAVLVIALFYTETIHLPALTLAGFILLLLIITNQAGIRKPLPYAVLSLLLWLAFMKSGIHATLAGVLAAFTIPARSSIDAALFVDRMTGLVSEFKGQIGNRNESESARFNILKNAEKQAILQSIENGVHLMESPLQRMEHNLHGWVSFLIVPVFALANAGVPIELGSLDRIMTHPVTLGVMAGLVFGKPAGILASSWLVVAMGFSRLPAGVTFRQIIGIGLLAGIGFTMSIFIGALAFGEQPELLLNAKIGIVFASFGAGICGYLWLLMTTGRSSD